MEKDSQEINFVESIGKGGYGVVWRGKWCNQDVAVKFIHDKKSFETELTRLSSVNHPNIVKLYGACTAAQYIVMEYADFGSLYDVLHKSDFTVTLLQAIDWALQCARGIAHIHQKIHIYGSNIFPRHIIHRDIKSDNPNGIILKIGDWGLACYERNVMTRAGTLPYMAPEILQGTESYNESCDAYSFGILMAELFTRCIPFAGQANIKDAVLNGQRPLLPTNIPETLRSLITRCWSAIPFLRPSMVEIVINLSFFRQVLQTYLEARNQVPLPTQLMTAPPATTPLHVPFVV